MQPALDQAVEHDNVAELRCAAAVIWAHGVVISHPLSMREALGSIPSVSMLPVMQRFPLLVAFDSLPSNTLDLTLCPFSEHPRCM